MTLKYILTLPSPPVMCWATVICHYVFSLFPSHSIHVNGENKQRLISTNNLLHECYRYQKRNNSYQGLFSFEKNKRADLFQLQEFTSFFIAHPLFTHTYCLSDKFYETLISLLPHPSLEIKKSKSIQILYTLKFEDKNFNRKAISMNVYVSVEKITWNLLRLLHHNKTWKARFVFISIL